MFRALTPKGLLLGLLIGGAFASAALAAEECIPQPANGACPAGYLFRQGSKSLTQGLGGLAPPVYVDNQCCRTLVDCTGKLGTPGCPYPSLGGWAGANIDMPGGDYQSFDLNGTYPSDCRDACAKDSKCQAWTYVQPGVQGPKARCWLKASVPPAHPNTCCISEVMEREDLHVH